MFLKLVFQFRILKIQRWSLETIVKTGRIPKSHMSRKSKMNKMKNIYLFVFGLLLCFNLQGQVSQFVDSLMFGGRIDAYAQNSSCVLVATQGGIFKTTNEGQSWSNATQNFDIRTNACNNIVSIGNDFFAMPNGYNGANLYKSTNDGADWIPLTFTTWQPQSLGKIANTLYVVGSDWLEGRLYSSTDGVSWIQGALIWDNSAYDRNCRLLSFNQNRLYLVFKDSIFFTTDGNTIDTILFDGLGSSGFGNDDKNLGGDAYGNLYFYDSITLYQYDFNLNTWIDISTGQIPVGFQVASVSVTDNAIFLSAMNSSLGLRMYRSTNQGLSFSELTSTGLAVPMITDIIEVSANGFIGAGIDDRVLISSNVGDSWTSTSNQYIATTSGNLIHSGNSILFAREIVGIVSTSDQGLNWNTENAGVPNFGGIAYFVSDITQVMDTLFLFVRPDPWLNQYSLYKSIDNGNSWISCPIASIYNGEQHSFAGSCDSALFVSYYDPISYDYALIVSFDNGNSWVKPNAQNNIYEIYLKGPQNCLFAFYDFINNNSDGFNNVYRVNNFGATFTDLNFGNLFNDNFLIKRMRAKNRDRWMGEPMMDFNASNNLAMFAVNDRTMGMIDKLYSYNISSQVWSEIWATGLPYNYLANCIKYIGNNSWLLATNDGLYISGNGGADWVITHNPNDWQKGMNVNSIQVIGNYAFLGTEANGVWKADISVGILEQVKDNNLQVYPNPFVDLVKVVIPNFNGKSATVSLYSSEGKKIMSKIINNSPFELDLRNEPAGSYFIVVNANNDVYKKVLIRR